MQKRWIQLGIVGKAHGLNGAFFVSQRDEEIPDGLKTLRIGPSVETAKTFTIKSSRWQNDRPVMLCSEIASREAAEAICHQPIWADRDDMEIDEEEEYFWSDIVGKEVKDSQGTFFGTISEVANYGASDIVLIEDGKGRTVEVPFVEFYFDMGFDLDGTEIRLIVLSEVFDDTWTTQ
ncbi:MAG: 16S rRNA processing protein RimM [Chitinophagaceae bacterium]|nr:16S rRNA processing protein RimM [Oligoflexus sp.]